MLQRMPFSSWIELCIESIQTALGTVQGHRNQQMSLQKLKPAMLKGRHNVVKHILTTTGSLPTIEPALKRCLIQHILDLSRLTPKLLKDKVSYEVLNDSSSTIYQVGCDLEAIECYDMAYNLFEISYHLAAIVEKPCFDVATKLLELSNPKNVDQRYMAIWIFATERLRQSIKINGEWLEALDAVELALNVYVKNKELQQQLCDKLWKVIGGVKDTPLADLAINYSVQIPCQFIAPEIREKMVKMLVGMGSSPSDLSPVKWGNELVAATRSQIMVDDIRLRLLDSYTGRPSLAWHDLTLKHFHLVNAVPLGSSLTIDINRTSELVLELIHEVAHAHCLLSSMGGAIQTCRVGAHFWEMYFKSLAKRSVRNPVATNPENVLKSLSEDQDVLDFAEIQLASSYRSAVLEAVWLPWLEGVAQYVELLADPTEDPNGIIPVHEAVRSLVFQWGKTRWRGSGGSLRQVSFKSLKPTFLQ